MTTCKTLGQYFFQRVDLAYSGYLDVVKANRVFFAAMTMATNRKYLTLDEQKSFDEIAALINTNAVFQINNNQISTAPLPVVSVTVAGLFVLVQTFFPHNLNQGDSVVLSNVQGLTTTPGINGNTFIINSLTNNYGFVIPITGGSGTSTLNTGQVTTPKLIADYMHLEAVKCKFTQPLFGSYVIGTSNLSPINIFFPTKQMFRDGSMISLSNMNLLPSANGTFYTKQLNSTGYALYLDPDLQVPSTGGGVTRGSQGNVSMIWYEYAKPYISDRKIDQYEDPTTALPKYETANKVLKFYPQNRICSEITLDYIKKPFLLFTDQGGNQVPIDINDNNLDMELYYPQKYLYWVIDWTIKQFAMPLRDNPLNAEVTADLVEQP